MTTPRSKLVDPETPLHYHLVSRCVRRAWLCGKDPHSGNSYQHRKAWLMARIFHLAKYFAVEVDAFAILANHFHLVIYFDPTACMKWSDEMVAYRWVEAFPPTRQGKVLNEIKPLSRELLLANKDLLEKRRKTLGSLSAFMKHLKQPIAWMANKEDRCTGHFFETRFYSGALLSEQAVLAAMAYVDLNPVRAKLAKSIEQCRHTSIALRLKHLENSLERLDTYIKPLVSGLTSTVSRLELTMAQYIERLKEIVENELSSERSTPIDKNQRWYTQVASIRKRQHAYGPIELLAQWADRRGLKRPGCPLPG